MIKDKSLQTKCGRRSSNKTLNLWNTARSTRSISCRKMPKTFSTAQSDKTCSSGTSILNQQLITSQRQSSKGSHYRSKKAYQNSTNPCKKYNTRHLCKSPNIKIPTFVRYWLQKTISSQQSIFLLKLILIREAFFLKRNCWTISQKTSISSRVIALI